MRLSRYSLALCFVLSSSAVHSIFQANDSIAVSYDFDEEDSKVSDINDYIPDQYDCPLPCDDYANIHSWTPYLTQSRLNRCKEPMLLRFTLNQPLSDHKSDVLIRSCTLPSSEPLAKSLVGSPSTAIVVNPKKSDQLYRGSSLHNAPTCFSNGTLVSEQVQMMFNSEGEQKPEAAAGLLEGMKQYFSSGDNCDESVLFAHHEKTVIGIYIGAGLGKPTATSGLTSLINQLRTGLVSNQTIVELCGNKRQPERIFGIFLDTTGDLAAVQKAVAGWSKGICASQILTRSFNTLPGMKVWEVSRGNITLVNNDKLPRADNTQAIHHTFGHRLEGRDTVPKLAPPKPGADGVCATHLIRGGDTCFKLATDNGITVDDIEKWNKGKTWAWNGCENMLEGYNMCLSDGHTPMPPPQEGTQCGPLRPGTVRPEGEFSLADLNPCPLNACCSNWGFCGTFTAHCDIHAPPGSGPGSKEKGYSNTCVSNCGNEIKQNSGPPEAFQRIGYYEAFGLERECLLLKAAKANIDGSYTHIHWAFASINPQTWKPIVEDKKGQWNDFKGLSGVKRILSFGGWAYSTESATYNVIRSAIIENRETFASNLATFVQDEGIDGIDIDWEYPGAPDIYADGHPIGKNGDGAAYLKFLTVLKNKLGKDKSVSIAAPASYWYLQAFPIKNIAKVIDYIVYMTYDLHGQWDYGNPNAFDSCPSGKCIRSHVNLTETRNTLSMITKAGVPNNKIFVGEASYGRSFHMAQNDCWGPMCEFTGSRTQSDTQPGRCTNTSGYIAYAEIMEIINRGAGARVLHDHESNTDVMLYKGDYISYMTPTTKDTRRTDWKNLNFAGSIDWAVDLQSFSSEDFNNIPERPQSGEGCIEGADTTVNSGDLCGFTCNFGFCPEPLCVCQDRGKLEVLPQADTGKKVRAIDAVDPVLNQLCIFACKYGYCPDEICVPVKGDEADYEEGPVQTHYDYSGIIDGTIKSCYIYKDPELIQATLDQCYTGCHPEIEAAKEENRVTSYGCVGRFPIDKPIPWERPLGGNKGDLSVMGSCSCDNQLVNLLAETVIDALAAAAQIGCYLIMNTLKLVIEIGAEIFPPIGRPISVALDAVTSAAGIIHDVYSKDEDPQGAWDFWLSPCGGSDLVPDDLKTAFNTLHLAAGSFGSIRTPKGRKGSGKKGDKSNPGTKPAQPPPPPVAPPKKKSNKKKKCNIRPGRETQRIGVGKNTLRVESCDAQSTTQTTEYVITSLTYGAGVSTFTGTCLQQNSQACYHYKSAISNNPQWGTLTCPDEAATTAHRLEGNAINVWRRAHNRVVWEDVANRAWKKQCQRDEWPPAYFLSENDPAWIMSGKGQQGQKVRFLPGTQNGNAGKMWKGVCFRNPLEAMSDANLMSAINGNGPITFSNPATNTQRTHLGVRMPNRPRFTLEWRQSTPPNDGLFDNPCWPSSLAVGDPGFALLELDEWYDTNPQNKNNKNKKKWQPGGPNDRRARWEYNKDYVKGQNGD